jgi:hypothetical protein
MVATRYKYVSDDGSTYQILVDAELAGATAGDLVPAVGTELPLPVFFVPRSMICHRQYDSGFPRVARVPCNATNVSWQSGLGAVLFINSAPYVVTRLEGELRPQTEFP